MGRCPPVRKGRKRLQKQLIQVAWGRSPKLLSRELGFLRWRGLLLGCWMPVLR